MPTCPDATGEIIGPGGTVIIVGLITEVHPGNPCIIYVDVQQGDQTVNLPFRSTELVKGEIDGSTITGVLSGPT